MMRKVITLALSFGFFSGIAQTPQLQLSLFKSGFTSPTDIQHCKDDRLFIVEQDGYIRIIQNGNTLTTPFLDINSSVNSNGNEQGLLGLAFHPNYKQNGYFYVNYTTGTGAGSTRISRFSVLSTDSNRADAGSEQVLLTFTQPYTNHNGGTMHFGPDGYLYVGVGDGGSANDPQGNGQNLNTYLGKLLRLDVDAASTIVPAGNPFVGQSNVKEEIWAYGMRNPWRISFDRIKGDLWIADVGQGAYEEIDFQPASSPGGENYGWRCREGAHQTAAPTGCTLTGYTDPIYEYTHANSNCSVTGGYVYRGAQHQNLFGKYLFTDYCSGRFWETHDSAGTWVTNVLGSFLTFQYSTFGEDKNGELYIGGRANGNIYTIRDTSSCNPVAFISLKDTLKGCGNSLVLNALSGNGLAYEWENGTSVIPGAQQPAYRVTQEGNYRVRVVNFQGCESTSSSVFVLLNRATPVEILGLSTTYCLLEASVNLQANVSGGSFTINGNASTVFDPAQLGTGNYEVIYSYLNAEGCISSDTVDVRVNICSGVNSISNNEWKVYPNPARESFVIRSNEGMQSGVLNITDAMGKLVYRSNFGEKTGNEIKVQTEGWPAGVYTLRITGNQQTITHSVLIRP